MISDKPYEIAPCDPAKLKNSELLCHLLHKQTQSPLVYMGYTRYIQNDTVIQLFQNIYNLSTWFEIKVDDIIHCHPADDFLPFKEGYILWLKEDSNVIRHETSSKEKAVDAGNEHGVKIIDDDGLHREQYILQGGGRLNITVLEAASGGRTPPPPCRRPGMQKWG